MTHKSNVVFQPIEERRYAVAIDGDARYVRQIGEVADDAPRS
jgi:hypothetical protein